jgi:hypothetical protein
MSLSIKKLSANILCTCADVTTLYDVKLSFRLTVRELPCLDVFSSKTI